MRTLVRTAILWVVLAMGGCVGTDVGNPQDDSGDKAEVELHFAGYERTHSDALVLESNTTVEAAWVVMNEFRFQRAGSCGEGGAYEAVGPAVIDLLADQRTYEPPRFTKVAGEYCQLDIGFATASADQVPDGAPEYLADHAIVVDGERADGVAYSIRGNLEDKFHLVGAMHNFELDTGSQHLIVGFALDAWIDEQKLDDIDDEDPIIIDSEHHPELLDDFYKQVKQSADLFRDRNDNGRLDADERRDSMARGREHDPGGNGPPDDREDAGDEGDNASDVGR